MIDAHHFDSMCSMTSSVPRVWLTNGRFRCRYVLALHREQRRGEMRRGGFWLRQILDHLLRCRQVRLRRGNFREKDQGVAVSRVAAENFEKFLAGFRPHSAGYQCRGEFKAHIEVLRCDFAGRPKIRKGLEHGTGLKPDDTEALNRD